MRVALLHPRAALVGGVERQIHDLGVRLADAGHEVHWICSTRDARVDARIRCHRAAASRRASCARAARRALRSPRPARARAPRTLRRRAWLRQDLAPGRVSRRQRLPRGLPGLRAREPRCRVAARRCAARSPHASVVARIERERYRPGSCRFVLPISALVRDQILRRYDLPPERVRVLHPAVDTARFTPRLAPAARAALRAELALPAAAPLLVFVGSDFRRKGLPALLAALRWLPGAHALVLGGDRPARARRQRELAARARRRRARALRGRAPRSRAPARGGRLPGVSQPLRRVRQRRARGDGVGAAGGGEPPRGQRRGGDPGQDRRDRRRAGGRRGARGGDPAVPRPGAAQRGRSARAAGGGEARLAAQLERVLAVYGEVVEEKRREAALTRSGSAGAR